MRSRLRWNRSPRRTGWMIGVLVLVVASSCSSLKHNYLGKTKRNTANFNIGIEQLIRLDSIRKRLDSNSDSLVRDLSVKKEKNKHLTAIEINKLYSNLGVQLEFDRIYNSILQSRKTKKKMLTPTQRYAGAYLLKSAYEYDQNYQKNKSIRRAINRGDIANKIPRNVLQKSRRFLYFPKIRRKLSLPVEQSKADPADELLRQLPPTNFFKAGFYSLYRHNDRISSLFYNIFPYAGNSLFGKVGNRITNRVKQRKYATQLLSVIQPYDILISKSPGHLSAAVIPGYFGHAAIWLGDKVPSKRKKIMDVLIKERGARYKLREKGMAEALRSGVQLSNLEEYADGEVFVILRPTNLSADQQTKITENTIKQLHKKYDFNFDIESPDMINCTELVYLAYDFIDWKVRYYMGRYTLFPDDLLHTALTDGHLKVVAILKNGELTTDPEPGYLRGLIK
jgi:hypothetical protein